MNGGELTITPQTLNRMAVFMLYTPVCLIGYWWLLPRLSLTAKRLASFILAAQIVVIVVSLENRPTSDFELWLWHVDYEWNIPATLASTQLALVGGLALMTACFATGRPAWQRLYLVAIGLIFLFVARDEYYTLHEFIYAWRLKYAAVGALVAAATLVVALRSPRRSLIWHVCMLAGLAMSATGALFFDEQLRICGGWGVVRIEPCLDLIFLEEVLEFLGIWLALIALLGQFSDVSPSPSLRVQRALYVLPALWILLLIQSAAVLPIARQNSAQPAAVAFESGVKLHSYRIEFGGRGPALHLHMSPVGWDFKELGYLIHLVDQVSGDSIASQDKMLSPQLKFLMGPGYVPAYRQWVKVVIPPETPAKRALWILLTLWRKEGDEFIRQRIIESDHRTLAASQVILGEMVLQEDAAASPAAAVARFENGFFLDAFDMPPSAQASENLPITFYWRSDEAGSEELIQFLHIGYVSALEEGGKRGRGRSLS